MAVPKNKTSKSKKRSRRANWKILAPNLRPCPQCYTPGLPHMACPVCGTYNGRQVVQIKTKKDKSKKEN